MKKILLISLLKLSNFFVQIIISSFTFNVDESILTLVISDFREQRDGKESIYTLFNSKMSVEVINYRGIKRALKSLILVEKLKVLLQTLIVSRYVTENQYFS